ncbi:hypothetical protein CK203_004757 [Vitis vinifera]|uniref:Uncharacterized protein n=1 Tax=Vitis vinifera TaxID=29760 RepID=A0A438KFR0_VITVI|nr:hypothetical protein CK203_004757 [Vitis vinifera]
MSSKKKATSSSRASDVREKVTDKLDVKEFRDRFCIPNGVIVELLNDEEVPASTEKFEKNTIIFSKEQFNAGLRFPLPALFKEFLHFTQIPPAFIHPNIVRVLMGCSIISMLYNLDLTLLEVFFVYSLKKVKNDIFSMSAHLPSLQLVTELPDSTKGGARDTWRSRGGWAGFSRRPGRLFSPNYSLVIPAFVAVNADAKERHYKTLLTVRNLMVVVREPQESLKKLTLKNAEHSWIIGRRKKNKGTLRKALGQKRGAASPPHKAPAKKRKLVKNGKRVREPTPPKEFAPPPITHEAEVIIEELVNPAPHSISSGSGHVAGLNHSSTSLAAVARLANLAEEAASINHPDSLIRMSMQLKPFVRPRWRKRGQKARLLIRLQRSSGGGEVEVATKTLPVLVVPDEDAPDKPHPAENVEAPNPEQESSSVASSSGNLVNDAACTSASPFSYAELEDKLKQIPPGLTTVMPSAKMFEMVESLVSGLRGMANQYDLFTDLLRTTDYMKAFATRRKDTEDQLRLRLGEAEASLSTVREDNEALRADLAEAKGREESSIARLHEVEDEIARLRAQKEELEREFAAEREELEADYKKQVDDTFIFGYRCCMKKNGIKRDVPSIPPGEEKKLHDKPAP